MKIPEKFTIGGAVYSVIFKTDYTNANSFGYCDPVKCEIIIHNVVRGESVSESTKLNSFLHEPTHAILAMYAYETENDNEKLICAMASGLTQFITSVEALNTDEK